MTQTERDRLIIVEGKIDNLDERFDTKMNALSDKMDIFIKAHEKCEIEHDKTNEDFETRIRALENQPSKRWNTVVTTVITVAVTAGITFIISHFS